MSNRKHEDGEEEPPSRRRRMIEHDEDLSIETENTRNSQHVNPISHTTGLVNEETNTNPTTSAGISNQMTGTRTVDESTFQQQQANNNNIPEHNVEPVEGLIVNPTIVNNIVENSWSEIIQRQNTRRQEEEQLRSQRFHGPVEEDHQRRYQRLREFARNDDELREGNRRIMRNFREQMEERVLINIPVNNIVENNSNEIIHRGLLPSVDRLQQSHTRRQEEEQLRAQRFHEPVEEEQLRAQRFHDPVEEDHQRRYERLREFARNDDELREDNRRIMRNFREQMEERVLINIPVNNIVENNSNEIIHRGLLPFVDRLQQSHTRRQEEEQLRAQRFHEPVEEEQLRAQRFHEPVEEDHQRRYERLREFAMNDDELIEDNRRIMRNFREQMEEPNVELRNFRERMEELQRRLLRQQREQRGRLQRRRPLRPTGLSDEKFNEFERRTYNAAQEEEDKLDVCPICLYPRKSDETIVILPCTHRYHEYCGKQLFKTMTKCSVCRKDYNVNV